MGSDRSAATRRRLCLAAEALVARSGLEAVTLRTVAAAAGQRNTAAVSYHFGSLKNLLRAVVEMRVLDEEPERRRLVELLTDDPTKLSTVDAWRCIMRPILNLPDEQAPHAYARFLVHMSTAGLLSDPFDAGVERPGAPMMKLLLTRLNAGLAHLPYELARARVSLCALTFWNAIILHDERALGAAGIALPVLTADVERMVETILREPAAELVGPGADAGARRASTPPG